MTILNFCLLIMRTAGKDMKTGGLRIVFLRNTVCNLGVILWAYMKSSRDRQHPG